MSTTKNANVPPFKNLPLQSGDGSNKLFSNAIDSHRRSTDNSPSPDRHFFPGFPIETNLDLNNTITDKAYKFKDQTPF